MTANNYDFHSTKATVMPPNPIPNYVSLEDLNYVHFCRNFFNFTYGGYSVWIDRHYSAYIVKFRGFKGHYLEGSLSFSNPHTTTSLMYSHFKTAVQVFRYYSLRIIEAVDKDELFIPVNSAIAPVADSIKARRSRVVTRVFRTRQLLLSAPTPRFNGWLFDIF